MFRPHLPSALRVGAPPGRMALVLGLVFLAAAPIHAQDLESFRHLLATERARGLDEARAALGAGEFSGDAEARRMLLWFMGGAAIGEADEEALAEVREHLDAMAGDGDAVARSLSGFLLGSRLLQLGQQGQGLVEVLQAANALSGIDDPGLRRIATGELCRAYAAADRLSDSLVHCRRHRALVEGDPDRAARARAEYLEASVLSRSGQFEEAIELWTRAREGFAAAGLDGLADRTAGSLAADLINVGDGAAALPMAEIALRAAEQTGSPTSLAISGGVVGEALLQLGRPSEARQALEDALAAIDDSNQPGVAGYLLIWLQAALEAEPEVDSVALASVTARREAIEASAVQPSPEEAGTIESLEQRLVQQELDLRIRELEQEARIQQLELESVLGEAERQESALRAQRTTATLAVIASAALLAALGALLLLLRAQGRLAASLQIQALRDELTGLPNRRALVQAIEELVGEAGEHALLLVDVDHFKAVNDQGGHPFGDAVLAGIARKLQTTAPPQSLVARLGGEEFALLCPGLSGEEARALAEEVREGIAQEPFTLDGRPFRVTVSIGVAICSGGDYSDWIGPADEALYRAKGEGRNRVVEASAY